MKSVGLRKLAFVAGAGIACGWLATEPTIAGAGASSTYIDYLHIDLAKGGIQSDLGDLRPYRNIRIGGVPVSVSALPAGLVNHPEIGIVTPDWIGRIQVIQRFPVPPGTPLIHTAGAAIPAVKPFIYVDCPRMVITRSGDYLLTVIAGKAHYLEVDPSDKVNDILIYRSHDRGETWRGPFLPTKIAYNQHAWVPLLPSKTHRIYMFGTEPAPGDFNGEENAGIGFRYSDDDGRDWSQVTRIRPVNDPGFQGMFCIRMTETIRGTWLLAPHTSNWHSAIKTPGKDETDTEADHLESRLYVLRSEDRGKSWRLLPGKRPNGWRLAPWNRLDEGRTLALGNRVLLFARTMAGHLCRMESNDDGKTWTEPRTTGLVTADAPPMIGTLSDNKTIIALTHNRHAGGQFNREDRSELWISLSRDAGLTWSEPRFLAVTSTYEPESLGGPVYCMTYCDIVADRGQLNIFIPHLWRQVLYLRLAEGDLGRLPTRAQLSPGR